jgi:hypothetical protein
MFPDDNLFLRAGGIQAEQELSEARPRPETRFRVTTALFRFPGST